MDESVAATEHDVQGFKDKVVRVIWIKNTAAWLLPTTGVLLLSLSLTVFACTRVAVKEEKKAADRRTAAGVSSDSADPEIGAGDVVRRDVHASEAVTGMRPGEAQRPSENEISEPLLPQSVFVDS